MKNHYSLLLILLLFSQHLFSQKITGLVHNSHNEPIAGVSVSILKTTKGVSTDTEGRFQIEGVSTGRYTLKFTFVGFEPLFKDITVENQNNPNLDIELTETSEQLQTIEVVGRKETEYKNSVSFVGTKTATALKDVPQSISYVTKELILDQAAFRLNDVVKNMSGVTQFSFYNDLTVRGHRIQGGQNSSILVNGQRAFTSFWKQQLIPHIERVEVIKGPASALFGNASAGGTINRVTKKPLDEKAQSISTTFGSFNTMRALADFTGSLTQDKTVLYRINLGYENSGSFRNMQYDKNLIIAPSLSFLPSKNTRINADLVIQTSEGRLDRGQSALGNGDLYSTSIKTSLNSVNDYLKEETYNFTLGFSQKITNKLVFNASYMHSNYNEDLLEHRSANTYAKDGKGAVIPSQVEMQVFIRKRTYNADNFTGYFNYELETGRLKHKLLLGYDYAQQELMPGGSQLQARGYRNATNTGAINTYNPAQSSRYLLDASGNPVPNVPHFDLTASNPYVFRDMSKYFYTVVNYDPEFLRTQGVYLQDQIQIGKFQALLGLRQDYFTDIVGYNTSNATEVTQHAFLPRLGLVYSANQHINVYGTYVNGYQPQTASVISNPLAGGPFDPLISRLYEVGAKSEWLDKRLVVSTAIYHLRVTGQLYNAGEAGNPDKMIQMGEEISKGVELDVAGYIAPYWTITANYAFNDAKITSSTTESDIGRQKPNAPRHQGNLWTKYTIHKGSLSGLGLGLGTNYVADRYGSIFDAGTQPQVFPAYQLWNAGIYYNLKKVRLQLNLNNLTNKTHWVGGYDYLRAFPGAPRNFLMTVTYNL
ncbi:TonB-dependent receptor [Flectobacillus longus]|uniref:TonB-dependent receptor n=1 Tax=Flectobacillus longus TaxID=2984207 RepID=UPI0024B712CC|nr:TonB-dependent receptor [Flectobacillus longus]MDI9881584.1 TonB-dependent receptor [Flectobacillus longus]